MSEVYDEENLDIKEELGLAPFTHQDAVVESYCDSCNHQAQCPIIVYVNKLSVKRDGKHVDGEFGCSIFQEIE
jgi:hypothetical protein